MLSVFELTIYAIHVIAFMYLIVFPLLLSVAMDILAGLSIADSKDDRYEHMKSYGAKEFCNAALRILRKGELLKLLVFLAVNIRYMQLTFFGFALVTVASALLLGCARILSQ